jgi:hypothetical protein
MGLVYSDDMHEIAEGELGNRARETSELCAHANLRDCDEIARKLWKLRV